MRNLSFVLAAVAVVALATPAFGISTYTYFKGGSIAAGEGDWHTLADWGLWETDWALETGGWIGTPAEIPTTGGNVRGDATCHIWADVSFGTGRIRTGYTQLQLFNCGGFGNIIVEQDPNDPLAPAPNISGAYIRMGLWNWTVDDGGNPMTPCTWTQTAGTVTCEVFDVSRYSSGDGPPNYPDANGYAIATISGGTLNETSNGIQVGWSTDGGTGTFKVVGDAATINGTSYIQNSLSTTEIVLTSTGDITLIDISGDATLEGILKVDASAFSGVKTVDVLNAAGTLDYTALSLDAASIAAGYSLGDDGAGTLQVTVPEPMTMALLGFGLLPLLRRRKK